jgi:hypothetical protein
MADPATQGASIADELPAQVELREVGVAFTLPAGKSLSRTVQRELRTELSTHVRLRASAEEIALGFGPAILIDAQWPARNMLWSGAKVRFSSAGIEVLLAPIDGAAEGLVDFSADAKKQIHDLVAVGLSGTAMARPGYDPLRDPAVFATLGAIADNLQKQPPSGASDVTVADIGDPCAEAAFAMRAPFVHAAEGGGLSIPAGGVLRVRIVCGGSLSKIAAAGSVAEGLRAANIQAIVLESDALSVLHGEAPVAELLRVRIERGGGVKIEQMRLQGTVGEAEGIESLVRVLGGAVGLAGQGSSVEAGVKVAAHSPEAGAQIVPGMVKETIEAALSEGVRALLRQYADAVPGVDLRQMLGA